MTRIASELSGTSATYVSTQGPEFCSAKLHAGEGVHFTMAGYTRMWQKAAEAVKFPTVVASAEAAHPEASEPGRKSKRRHAHRGRKHRHHRQEARIETPSETAPQ